MTKAFVLSRVCWMQHLSLNFTTGLDPDGIRVRNAQGLDAIDFFMPGAHLQLRHVLRCALALLGHQGSLFDRNVSRQHHACCEHRRFPARAAADRSHPRHGSFRSAPCGSMHVSLRKHTAAAAGYDVWAKTIEALADIGYDNTNLIAMPYDWRLSLPNMELRDGYFTKLRSEVRPNILPSLHLRHTSHPSTSVLSHQGVFSALPTQCCAASLTCWRPDCDAG